MRRPELVDDVSGQGVHIHRGPLDGNAASDAGLREVEQVPDHPLGSIAGRGDPIDRSELRFVEVGATNEESGGHEDGAQGIAEIVAHDAGELALELDPLLEGEVHAGELRLVSLEVVEHANQLLILSPNLIERSLRGGAQELRFDGPEQLRRDRRRLRWQALAQLDGRSTTVDRVD